MFEQTLRDARQAQGMTQQELAARLFVSRQTVSSWETGRNLPNLETLTRLAELLGVSTDYLLGRTTQNQQKRLQVLPTVLVVLVIVRLAIAETTAMLRLADIMLGLVLALLAYARFGGKVKPLLWGSGLLGLGLMGLAWGQIFGMAFENQLAYVVCGSLLVSETAWLYAQGRFPARGGLMRHKGWWLGNGVFGLLVVSSVIWILIRRVDGSGHIENMGSRLLALGVLGALVAGVVIVELIVYRVLRRDIPREK